jgi:hypothetical protein
VDLESFREIASLADFDAVNLERLVVASALQDSCEE